MKMSKVGNQTNSQDPQAVSSRVFVGNLNTFQCSKTDLERMFQRYGRLAGISMHKGYAFIQFSNPHDARSACLGEDGRTVLGQTLDVNLVAEPKFHQVGRKRQNLSKTGNDWEYYYDSYYASNPVYPVPRIVPPVKKPRLMFTSPVRVKPTTVTTISSTSPVCMNNNNNVASSNCSPNMSPPINSNISPAHSTTVLNKLSTSPTQISVNQLKTYSNPDILICGNCREMFSELQELLEHKKSYCKLRFTCKCTTLGDTVSRGNSDDKSILLCVHCKDTFDTAWDLLVHVQAAHMVNIFELGAHNNNNSAAIINNNLEHHHHHQHHHHHEEVALKNGHSRLSSEKDNHSEEEDKDGECDMNMTDSPVHIKSTTEAIVHALSLDQSMLIIENHHLDNSIHTKEILNGGSF